MRTNHKQSPSFDYDLLAAKLADLIAGKVQEAVRSELAMLTTNSKEPPIRVDFKTLMQRLHTKKRTLRRYVAAKIIPVDQVCDGGNLLFDPVAVDRALKRYRRSAVGDDD